MKLNLLTAGLALAFLAPVAASAANVAGISINSEPNIVVTPPVNIQATTPPPVGATVINFDDVAKPISFINIVALKAEYVASGVTFSGPALLDGGGTLNEGSSFGVSGHSAPNFLAFNLGAAMSDGGIPQGPETLTFASPQDHVQINAGSASAGVITMDAYNAVGTLIGTSVVSGTSALQTLSIATPGISSVVISFTGTLLVLDDLAFATFAPVSPTPAYSLQLKSFSDCVNVWFDPANGITHGNVPIYGPGTIVSGLFAGQNVVLGFSTGASEYIYDFNIASFTVDLYKVNAIGDTKTLVNSDTWSAVPAVACTGIMSQNSGNTAVK